MLLRRVALVLSLRRALYALVFLSGGAYLFIVLSRGDAYFARANPVARIFDEGSTLARSTRILAGEIPYKDFWTIYAPGSYYTLAALFRIFGVSITVERAWDFVVRFVLCLAVYFLTKQLTSARTAIVPFVLVVLWLAVSNFYAYAAFPALTFMLLSAIAFLSYLSNGRHSRLFAAGALIGLAALYRDDFGFYGFASESGLLAILAVAQVGLRRRNLPILLRSLRVYRPYIAGLFSIIVVPSLFFVVTTPLSDLLYTFIVYPLTIFRTGASLPFPNLIAPFSKPLPDLLRSVFYDTVPFYAPPAAYAVASFGLLATARSGAGLTNNAADRGLMLLLLIGFGLLNQALNRADRIHLLPMAIVGVVVLTVVAYKGFSRSAGKGRIALVVLTVAVLAPWYVGFPLQQARDALQDGFVAPCIARADCTWVAQDQLDTIRYVQGHAGPLERVFVGNTRHDRVFANDALFYFLVARRNATRYDDLRERAPLKEVQESIVQDLQRRGVNYLVLFAGFDNVTEPNESSRSSGVRVLDDYIRREYQLTRQFGRYTVWERR